MAFGPSIGLQSLLKEGHKHLSGVDEAVLKNIEACKQLAQITRTSLGPNGMNKMIINHLEKLFVTADAATIVQELEVQHPAAKLLVLAARAQQEEVGDGSNTVISLGGALLAGAEELIRSGLHPSDVISGYGRATTKALELLDSLAQPGSAGIDVRSESDVALRLSAAVGSKQFGQEGVLCPLIAKACMQVCPKNPASFNVDNVRVAKVLGAGLLDSYVVSGMVLRLDATGTIKRAAKAKVAVFGGGIDTQATETKGTVLIESAQQLENYARTEEQRVEELIKAVAASGATVVVSGQTVGEMALHFCERYKLMVLKISSKFELRRFCRATGAVSLVKLQQPMPDELGFADSIVVEEIGGTTVCVVRNEAGGSKGSDVATIVLRGSTDSILDDVERAVDDGVNTYKSLCRDSRIVPGGGATEIELSRGLKAFARTEMGLEQYAIDKFATALEVIPRTLAENAGLDATQTLSALYSAHAEEGEGSQRMGINVLSGGLRDVSTDEPTWDLYTTKYWALRFAADAACTVLRVDQIIMAKVAGGPRRGDKPVDEGDE